MVEGPTTDLLDPWMDCYTMTPKRRIKVDEAKREVQRAWAMWDGEKSAGQAMMMFFAWLQRHRPYFLTFRSKGDRWQRVKSWLIQWEQNSRQRT